MKVTFLTVMPSPYVQDLFAAMACDDRFDLRVLYMEQEAPDTYWGEQVMPDYAEVLPGQWVGISGARVHVNPGIADKLDSLDSDLVVICGYIGLTNQLAMRHLVRNKRPWCFWGEIPGFRDRGLVGRKIRSLLQRPLRSASGVAAVGSRAVEAYKELLSELNADSTPVHNIPYHCDLDPFHDARVRRASGSGPVNFLYCGQLIERKGVDLLLAAFCKLIEEGSDARLTLAGEGPLRTEMEKTLTPEAREHVRFLGFQPVGKLPEIFSRADVFVLPSRHDGWGVVINQALASALPVIATSNVGAAHDLVSNGINGFVIPSCSWQDLHQALQHFVHSRDDLLSFSEHSRVAASRLSLDCAVQQWSEFLSASIQHLHRKSELAK
ncbi:MAG: group 1 glycosyl transferase [Planctomyces sp.]|nr:group 1 glycosyl transferase [Planctomyces sp.]